MLLYMDFSQKHDYPIHSQMLCIYYDLCVQDMRKHRQDFVLATAVHPQQLVSTLTFYQLHRFGARVFLDPCIQLL